MGWPPLTSALECPWDPGLTNQCTLHPENGDWFRDRTCDPIWTNEIQSKGFYWKCWGKEVLLLLVKSSNENVNLEGREGSIKGETDWPWYQENGNIAGASGCTLTWTQPTSEIFSYMSHCSPFLSFFFLFFFSLSHFELSLATKSFLIDSKALILKIRKWKPKVRKWSFHIIWQQKTAQSPSSSIPTIYR